MKFIFYLFLICSLTTYSQNEKVINMSYNLNNEVINENYRKIIEKNGKIVFYFKGNYFEYIKNSEIINVPQVEIEKINFKILSNLISYRNKLIKKNIKDSEKKGKLKILENSEVYRQIYIFEKEKGSIFKYPVTWLEVIECQ